MPTNYRYKRKSTRSRTWPETEATIKFLELVSATETSKKKSITGGVVDLGASGMFLKTSEVVPTQADVEIEIRFDPESKSSKLRLHASGKTIRSGGNGIGIEFKSIDLTRLQKCIIEKMHRAERLAKSTHGTDSVGRH